MTVEIDDPESTYDMVRSFISRRSVAHAEQRAVEIREIKTSLCANGSYTVEAVETAVRALNENDEILRGDGYVTIDAEDDDWYRQVIEWCADRETPPRGLIGACNQRKQQLQQ